MFPLTILHTILLDVFRALISRTDLLHAYHIRNVNCSYIAVPSIQRRFKIIEYVKYFVAGWKNVLQWLHIAEMYCLFVLLTRFVIPFVTFMDFTRCDGTTARPAISHTLTVFLFSLFFLVVVKTCLAPKVSVAFETGDSNPFGYTRRACHTITTCLFAFMCGVTTTSLTTCVTHIVRP